MKNILVIDDEDFIRENLKRILEKEGYQTRFASTGFEGIDIVEKNWIDVVLLDLSLPDINGIEVLRKIKEINPSPLVIIITGYATVDSAVEALKLGAYDYIKKPFKADAIRLIIKLALETQELKKEVDVLKKLGKKEERFIFESPLMKEVVKWAKEVAKHSETNVLILGESGTGKEIIARFIHDNSDRASKPFVDINCASVPEQLLESELFGYEKGAFTDAKGSKLGLFEEANGGTLFLDEIGEMPLSLQSKLLRVIETKSIRKVGSIKNIYLDVRIIAATNKNLQEASLVHKTFREDLYYRLNVFPINIPPLRERKEDIIPLCEHYLFKFSKIFGKRFRAIDEEARGVLINYEWKGNVRELKNIMERICIMHNDDVLKVEHLPSDIFQNIDLQEGIDNYDQSLVKKVGEFEKALIVDALKKTGGNILKASKVLNLPRGTLRHKIEKYKIII